jgi:hypothetical protein
LLLKGHQNLCLKGPGSPMSLIQHCVRPHNLLKFLSWKLCYLSRIIFSTAPFTQNVSYGILKLLELCIIIFFKIWMKNKNCLFDSVYVLFLNFIVILCIFCIVLSNIFFLFYNNNFIPYRNKKLLLGTLYD